MPTIGSRNEEHFLLHCHALKDERKDLIGAMCKIEGSHFLCLNATDKALLILKLQDKFANWFSPCTLKDVHSF